jgi:hypothetical protein
MGKLFLHAGINAWAREKGIMDSPFEFPMSFMHPVNRSNFVNNSDVPLQNY